MCAAHDSNKNWMILDDDDIKVTLASLAVMKAIPEKPMYACAACASASRSDCNILRGLTFFKRTTKTPSNQS